MDNSVQFSIKRVFLITLILSLCISAVISIVIFLFGNMGVIEYRLLSTTLIIALYSLTGLGSSTLYDKKRYTLVALMGMIFSIMGFIVTCGVIWDIFQYDESWKAVFIFVVLAFSTAHSSLLLLSTSHNPLVDRLVTFTIFCIAIVAMMLISLIISLHVDEFFYRLLGVFAILDVLGTLLTPIVRKLNLK